MKIIFSPKILNKNPNTPVISFKSSKIKPDSNNDIFIKSAKTLEVEQIKSDISRIYDEVYNDVIYLNTFVNPILREVKINKPELCIDNFSDCELAYKQSENKINVDLEYLKSNHYLIAELDENGNIISTCGILPEYKLEENLNLNPDMKAILLTKEEKEMYIKSSMGHELRHCIQTHLLLSCQEVNEIIKKPIIEKIKEIEDLIEELKKIKSDDFTHEKPKHYFLSYKPTKLLDKNSVLKKSLSSKSKEYWSVSELAYASVEYPEGERNDKYYKSYFSNPIETDAYRFESEYFLFLAQGQKNKKVRNDIILSIYSDLNYLANKYKECI